MKLVVGITGATGVIYGIKLLELLNSMQIEIHLIISNWAERIIEEETDYLVGDVKKNASYIYEDDDFNTPVASGSFKTDGMIIIPCSMKTLAGIAGGYASNLINRSADVTIKENRKLIIVPRETPFNVIHLENMLKLARIGVTILPPIPAFYQKPKTLDDIYNHLLSRILDQLNIENNLFKRWGQLYNS